MDSKNIKALYSYLVPLAIAPLCGLFAVLAYGEDSTSVSIQVSSPPNTGSNSDCQPLYQSQGYSKKNFSSSHQAPLLSSMFPKAATICSGAADPCSECTKIKIVCGANYLHVEHFAGGYCELHLPSREMTLLDSLIEVSNATCSQESPNPHKKTQQKPQQNDSEDHPDICGKTLDQLDFRYIFSFNLEHLIFQLMQCQPDTVCGIFGDSPGCDLADVIEEIYYHYISFPGLYDELFHILQTRDQWCGPLACMEYGSAKANLDAMKKFAALIIVLAEVDPQLYGAIMKQYCAELFYLEISVGIEKCICDLTPFTGAACHECISKANNPTLPPVCENRLTDMDKQSIIKKTFYGYSDPTKDVHSCHAYAVNYCKRRYCPEQSAICLQQNEQLILQCLNQQTVTVH